MNKFSQVFRIATHPRALRMALSGLGVRLSGDDSLGGLTQEETSAVVRWASRPGTRCFLEIGTLFGLTAAAVARKANVRVVAVDNFSWNPFGLTPDQHESFTKRIVDGCSVELVRSDAVTYLEALPSDIDPSTLMVFLDGSHAYEDVKREIEICIAKGVGTIAGHDFCNKNFGVTRAVRETLGEPDEVAGMCWAVWKKKE